MKRKSLIVWMSLILALSFVFCSFGAFASEAAPTNLTMEGASIRTEGEQGLRFVGKVMRADYDLTTGTNANFGILLIPQSMIGNNEKITVDTENVRMVAAKRLLTTTEEYYEFSAVLTEIPAEAYATDIVARAYVSLDSGYVYSEQISRSVKTVADLILSSDNPTEEELTVARSVLAIYEQVGNDILVDAENIWNATLKIPKVVEDFSLAPNECYVKVENGQTVVGVFNEKIDVAVESAMALWKENQTKLEEGYFENSSFSYTPVSYTAADQKLAVRLLTTKRISPFGVCTALPL